MYQNLSVEEKIELLKKLEQEGFEYVFTPINGSPYGLTEEQYIEKKRQEWEENCSDETESFHDWLAMDEDELVLGIDAELCSLEA